MNLLKDGIMFAKIVLYSERKYYISPWGYGKIGIKSGTIYVSRYMLKVSKFYIEKGYLC